MSKHKFKLETSEKGLRVLTVYYSGTAWQAAIDEGLAAYGLATSAGVQVIARPAKESAEMHGEGAV
jgi:hypothetical protein